jgi:hypothetical protein
VSFHLLPCRRGLCTIWTTEQPQRRGVVDCWVRLQVALQLLSYRYYTYLYPDCQIGNRRGQDTINVLKSTMYITRSEGTVCTDVRESNRTEGRWPTIRYLAIPENDDIAFAENTRIKRKCYTTYTSHNSDGLQYTKEGMKRLLRQHRCRHERHNAIGNICEPHDQIAVTFIMPPPLSAYWHVDAFIINDHK